MNTIEEVSYVALNHKFRATRVFADSITAVEFRLKLFCSPNRGAHPELSTAGHLGAISMQALMFWLDYALNDGTVLLDPNTEAGNNIFYAGLDNQMIFTPSPPDDFVLSRVIHSKICAITRGNVSIGSLMLTSSDSEWSERYWDSTEYALPDQYIDDELVHTEPWWKRPTLDTIDFRVADYSDEELEELRNMPDPLEQFEAELRKEQAEEAEIISDIWDRE